MALPLVAERLSTAYDAMSRRQTACLVSAVSEILVYDPAEESLKTLLGSARDALQACRFAAQQPWVSGDCFGDVEAGLCAVLTLIVVPKERG